MKTIRTLLFGFIAALALSATALAQGDYPNQRVTIIVPFGAGSVTDLMARIVADDLAKRWNQPVIVENRPGLAGTVAAAKAPPDGYTLMLTSNGHTVAALVNKNLPFDPIKDFAGITRVCSSPLMLITPPDLPARTVKDLLALAKEKPGKLNFSSAGLASTTFIAGALFRKASGVNIVHVPYKGAPEAVTAVMRGDAQMYFVPVNLAKELVEGGKVNALAAATEHRLEELPNVPTFTEAGLPFVYDSWFGLMTQAAVPRGIVDKINKDVTDTLKSPETVAKLKAQFVLPVSDTPQQFDEIIRRESANLAEVFKEAGVGN
jgi:tripartite-type tricarboxylate transporter receptor subunit TctC